MATGAMGELVVGLSAVIVAADAEAPYVLATRGAEGDGLPFGLFDPKGHRTFEIGLRSFVRRQTGFEPGYVEQLYTFGDRGRELPRAASQGDGDTRRVISVGYLGLTDARAALDDGGADWRSWYRYFPWEDHRGGRPGLLDTAIGPALEAWARGRADASDRAAGLFGLGGRPWIEERALERYELLYEARLVDEAYRDDGADRAGPLGPAGGVAMASDHRRILATAIGRLRGKIKYRPILFELTPPRFTLSELQAVAEALLGLPLHKQNFRRALDKTGFVEGTGALRTQTGGRPAELYRFARERLGGAAPTGVQTPTLR